MAESESLSNETTRELAQALDEAATEATFDAGRLGEFRVQQLRQIYSSSHLLGRLSARHAKTHVQEELLAKVADRARTLLSKYIVEDRIGIGLVLFGGGVATPRMEEYAADLVRAAAIMGSERLAQLLCGWERGEPIRYRTCAVLGGCNIDRPMNMTAGIRLSRLPTSSDALTKELPPGIDMHAGIMNMAGAPKVTLDCWGAPALFRAGDSWPEKTENWEYGPLGPSLKELCVALSLASNSRVSSVTYWFDFGDLAALGAGTGYTHPEGAGRGAPPSAKLSPEQLEHARDLLSKRLGATSPNKALDLAIDRWMRSKSHRNVYDRFIDLRIALEALYLEGMNDELSFRLANYGAWHLGADFEERRRYRETLGKAYNRASRAIHAGTKAIKQDERELLADAQDLCRRGILKRLHEQEKPNWDTLILGSEQV